MITIEELATELGVGPAAIVASLQAMRAWPLHSNHEVPPDLVRSLRAEFGTTYPTPVSLAPVFSSQRRLPTTPHSAQRNRLREGPTRRPCRDLLDLVANPNLSVRPPRREWYRGPEPSPLVHAILDHVIMPKRSPRDRIANPEIRWFADEVDEARSLSDGWAEAIWAGLSPEQAANWIGGFTPLATPDLAILFHHNGITPSEASLRTRGGAIYRSGDTVFQRVYERRGAIGEVRKDIEAWRAAHSA